ncbi:MAG: hypothetical protein AAF431_05790 [Pseudomonadota bacterium]
MPRPSLKNQRREEIVNAAMTCVARYGVSGLTLDKVADIAGLARPLIRHNIGNREQLIEAVTEHFVASSADRMNELDAHLSRQSPLTTAIDYLYSGQRSDTTLMLVAEALIAESANSDQIATVMRNWLHDFVAQLSTLAAREFPAAGKEKCEIVATGLTGIYFTVDSLGPIRGLKDFNYNAKLSALALLDQLR